MNDMVKGLASCFRKLEREGKVLAVLITGAGEAFSAGIDLTAASQVFKSDQTEVQHDIVLSMEACSFPIIGAVHGPCVTAGFEIALACDILLASKDAFFMDTHCKFGIMPGWGLSQKLSRMVGINRAREVAFTSKRIDAETAWHWGLVSHLCESKSNLMNAALGVAKQICRNHTRTVKNYKKVLNEGYGMTYKDGRDMERRTAWAAYEQMDPNHFDKLANFIKSRQQNKKQKLPSKL